MRPGEANPPPITSKKKCITCMMLAQPTPNTKTKPHTKTKTPKQTTNKKGRGGGTKSPLSNVGRLRPDWKGKQSVCDGFFCVSQGSSVTRLNAEFWNSDGGPPGMKIAKFRRKKPIKSFTLRGIWTKSQLCMEENLLVLRTGQATDQKEGQNCEESTPEAVTGRKTSVYISQARGTLP